MRKPDPLDSRWTTECERFVGEAILADLNERMSAESTISLFVRYVVVRTLRRMLVLPPDPGRAAREVEVARWYLRESDRWSFGNPGIAAESAALKDALSMASRGDPRLARRLLSAARAVLDEGHPRSALALACLAYEFARSADRDADGARSARLLHELAVAMGARAAARRWSWRTRVLCVRTRRRRRLSRRRPAGVPKESPPPHSSGT